MGLGIEEVSWTQGNLYTVHVDCGTYSVTKEVIVDKGDLIILNTGESLFEVVSPQHVVGGMTNFIARQKTVHFFDAVEDVIKNKVKYSGVKYPQDYISVDCDGTPVVYTLDEYSNGICVDQMWTKE